VQSDLKGKASIAFAIDLMVLYDPSPPWQMSEIGLNVLRAVCYHNTHPRGVDDLDALVGALGLKAA
jgi:hypothetical protein